VECDLKKNLDLSLEESRRDLARMKALNASLSERIAAMEDEVILT